MLTPVFTAVKVRESNRCTFGGCIPTPASLWVETIAHYKRGDSIIALPTDVRI